MKELIEHAVSEHGRKVKFLTLREIKARLDQNLLDGHALRAKDGSDNGVRLIDLNNDSYIALSTSMTMDETTLSTRTTTVGVFMSSPRWRRGGRGCLKANPARKGLFP